jgi:ABC-type uncharacterized transport system substrate-binding protein
MVTLDEQRDLQLRNAEADEQFWTSLRGMVEDNVAGQQQIANLAERWITDAKPLVNDADAKVASARDRIARLKKGEGVSGGLGNTPANLAAKNATSTIPIVFTTGVDPVQMGLVSNLRRPGGNVTGVSQLNAQLGPKRLELAHELIPAATVLALLVNPSDPPRVERLSKEMQGAAVPLGLRFDVLRAGTDADIEAAFAGFAQMKAGVMVIGADAYFSARSQLLAELSQRYAVPAIYQTKRVHQRWRPDELWRQRHGLVSSSRSLYRQDPQR